MAEETVDTPIVIGEVKRFNKHGTTDLDHFEVTDAEGVIYRLSDEILAKAAKDAKGCTRMITFRPVTGKLPELIGIAPEPSK